jgi:hypothetical protein
MKGEEEVNDLSVIKKEGRLMYTSACAIKENFLLGFIVIMHHMLIYH